jgi:hypothetical protein
MKNCIRSTVGAGVIIFFSAIHTFAIEGLKLSIHCPDVWLSWPSIEGETYIVQYRETLQTNTPWTTLTNTLPAESGTNLTVFVHSNHVDCPGEVYGARMSSANNAFSSVVVFGAASLFKEDLKSLRLAKESDRLAALYVKCQSMGRAPYDYELENRRK